MSLVVAVRHVGQEHRGEHVSVTTRHQLMGEGVVLVLAILHQHVTLKPVLVGIYQVLNILSYLTNVAIINVYMMHYLICEYQTYRTNRTKMLNNFHSIQC